METLPIVPDEFKLELRDDKRSKDQMKVVAALLRRDDIDLVVNACDAGREGELIFAYTYEYAGAEKPVERLWLSSMTNAAIKNALESLRPGSEFARLEQAARSRSEADWIVGMNATRAATIRLRSSFDGAVRSARPDPDAGDRRPAARRRSKPSSPSRTGSSTPASAPSTEDLPRAYVGHYQAPVGDTALRKGESRQRLFDERAADAVVTACNGQSGRSPSSRRRSAARPRNRCTT